MVRAACLPDHRANEWEEDLIMIRNQPRDRAMFGVDIGKTVFHVVGLDKVGAVLQKANFRRATLL